MRWKGPKTKPMKKEFKNRDKSVKSAMQMALRDMKEDKTVTIPITAVRNSTKFQTKN